MFPLYFELIVYIPKLHYTSHPLTIIKAISQSRNIVCSPLEYKSF